jgi:hypothetical protein
VGKEQQNNDQDTLIKLHSVFSNPGLLVKAKRKDFLNWGFLRQPKGDGVWG